MKSSELLALPDLAGYRLATCYWAKLSHGLMGTFPALIVETGDMFVCAEKQTLEKILSTMSKRKFDIETSLVLLNESEDLAFDIRALLSNHDMERDSESIRVVNEGSLWAMGFFLQTTHPPIFKWAPGLVGNDMSAEEFAETLRAALQNV